MADYRWNEVDGIARGWDGQKNLECRKFRT